MVKTVVRSACSSVPTLIFASNNPRSPAPEQPSSLLNHVLVSLSCLVNGLTRRRACPDEHGVEDCALAAAIWADEQRQRREVIEFSLTNATKTADFNRADQIADPFQRGKRGGGRALFDSRPGKQAELPLETYHEPPDSPSISALRGPNRSEAT